VVKMKRTDTKRASSRNEPIRPVQVFRGSLGDRSANGSYRLVLSCFLETRKK